MQYYGNMILGKAKSKNNVSIRLTDERWGHIFAYHKEFRQASYLKVFNVLRNPDVIFEGKKGELLAAKKYGKRSWSVVVYREVDKKDGFVITAYVTTDINWLFKRRIIWNQKQ